MKLSIVTTLYYSAPYIEEFYKRISMSLSKITKDYEIIFVNDGSPDNSLDIAVNLYKNHREVKVIDLSRNFGHHKAIMTGLEAAKGEEVFLIDCDLEEEPELLERFYKEFNDKEGVDVVYGVQDHRKGSILERFPAFLFYTLINLLSYHKVPFNPMTVRLMSRNYVRNLIRHKDREIFMLGLWVLTGFKQLAIRVNKHRKNSTTYNMRRKISNFVNAVTSFTNKPLVYIFYLGFFILSASIVYILYLVFIKMFMGEPPPGYSSIIVSLWFLGGLMICSLGVVGIYISKIFIETKDRPYTIVKAVYEK